MEQDQTPQDAPLQTQPGMAISRRFKRRKPPTAKQLENLKGHQFKPGQCGNPGGVHGPGKTVTSILREMLAKPIETLKLTNVPEVYRKRKICEAVAIRVLSEAINGDHAFLRELLDRTEGKVADRLAGHDGGPLPGATLNQAQINAILADPQAAAAMRSLADRLHLLAEAEAQPAGALPSAGDERDADPPRAAPGGN
ncbi:MAG: hypothetical protein HZA50_11680 [Planctomycetes bacterium]|nr:hypothetical protein [Planctomycetota bacterium]